MRRWRLGGGVLSALVEALLATVGSGELVTGPAGSRKVLQVFEEESDAGVSASIAGIRAGGEGVRRVQGMVPTTCLGGGLGFELVMCRSRGVLSSPLPG